MISQKSQYTLHWEQARKNALEKGLRIVEHGWEQHVIIDEANGLVYRFPRHQAAAAKLDDEVAVLRVVHNQSWPIQLPVMREHTPEYSTYSYIPGEPLSSALLSTLSDADLQHAGHQLGAFLRQFHTLDHKVVDAKKTRQTTSLLDYYTARINEAVGKNIHQKAAQALSRLTASDLQSVVVHGDLHGLNMIMDPITKSLNGVIDLSEIEIGDPHQDFRKLFMTDERLIEPAVKAYGRKLNPELVRTWAYVNEWANICHFIDTPDNPTYQRAFEHLQKWGQI